MLDDGTEPPNRFVGRLQTLLLCKRSQELVGLQPDLILASTTPVVTAVAQETDTIPIVVGGYPAAWCDERRPASLVTRRGGVHRRVAACGSKGSEPGHERGHNAQRPAGAEATPSARDDWGRPLRRPLLSTRYT